MTENPPPPTQTEDKTGVARFARFRDTSRAVSGSGAYSRRIGVLKRLLPVLAGVVLIALVAWPHIRGLRLASLNIKEIPGLIVENLHFTGLDSEQQPYSLSAKRATQVLGQKNLVELDDPEAEITLKSGAWLSSRAGAGRFDQENKALTLSQGVEIFHDEGSRLTAESLDIDLKTGQITGKGPVSIEGAFGDIQGTGLKLEQDKKTFYIQGPAKVILKNPAKPKQQSLHSTPDSGK